jgi:hypothetical protein
MHTHAHSPTPRHAQASRKAIKQMTERLRRDQREQALELQARDDPQAIPRNYEGPQQRIE